MKASSTALILPWLGVWPRIAASAWVAPTAVVTGDVVVGDDSSLWFGVVIRGDVHEIRIGKRTNIQDGSIIHATKDRAGTYIGDDVTIGHGAIIHACRLSNACFVGMGAIVLDEAVIEQEAMLAAGGVLTPGKRIPAGELWAGNPARNLRDLKSEERADFYQSARRYREYAAGYQQIPELNQLAATST